MDGVRADFEELGGFDAEGDFGAVDAVDAGVAARCASGCNYVAAGEEAEFHEAAAEIFGNVQRFENCGLATAEVDE